MQFSFSLIVAIVNVNLGHGDFFVSEWRLQAHFSFVDVEAFVGLRLFFDQLLFLFLSYFDCSGDQYLRLLLFHQIR